MITVDLDPRTVSYRALPNKSFQCNTELLTAGSWLSFAKKYHGYFAAALSRISGPAAITFGQQSAHETFKQKLTWKAMQHVFQYCCSLSLVKLEAHDSDHNSMGAYENAIWGSVKNLTKFLPIHVTCYPVIGKTNKQAGLIWSGLDKSHWLLIALLSCTSFNPLSKDLSGKRKSGQLGLCVLFFSFFNRHSVSLFLAQHHPNSQR